MPKECKALANFTNSLIKSLPEFLDQTVDHRLKQVAQRNSMRYLSQSIDNSRRDLHKDYWSKLSGGKNSPSPMNYESYNSSFEKLPIIDPKLAPLTSRSRMPKIITHMSIPESRDGKE